MCAFLQKMCQSKQLVDSACRRAGLQGTGGALEMIRMIVVPHRDNTSDVAFRFLHFGVLGMGWTGSDGPFSILCGAGEERERMDLPVLYAVEQIEIPSTLGEVLKDLTKNVIRAQPASLSKFCAKSAPSLRVFLSQPFPLSLSLLLF